METNSAYQMIKTMKETTQTLSGNNLGGSEYLSLKDPEALKTVAKEMEANFAYQMIKAMRETTQTLSGNNLGGSEYLSLFDMELARIFAERGLGLQDILFKELNNSSLQETSKHSQSISKETEPEDFINHPIKSEARISSEYGLRKDPFTDKMKFHHGLDISAPPGTNIYPIRHGKVIYSGKQSGYGNVVIIDHGDALISKYAHNKTNYVKVGDDVDTNTIIAQVGTSGRTTGPHLHLEIRDKDNKSLDPDKLIASS
jgi:murein DD-endopeptidase MepM/ murein hydrolase activator NlpD